MTCCSAAGFEVQEFGFVALEGFRDGLLRVIVNEFANVEGSDGGLGEQQRSRICSGEAVSEWLAYSLKSPRWMSEDLVSMI